MHIRDQRVKIHDCTYFCLPISIIKENSFSGTLLTLIERQRAMLLEVYKCIHELGPRYRHGMFSQKSRAYDYRDPSILTLQKYNTITHGKKCFMYEGAKLWNSISNGIKTIENISEFKTLLKKWIGSPCICKNCIICTISYM